MQHKTLPCSKKKCDQGRLFSRILTILGAFATVLAISSPAYKVPQLLFLTGQNLSNSYPNTATCALLRMPYSAFGMLTPFSEYNEKTIRKSPNTQNYSMQSMEHLPVIIAEVCVAHSGESFRNTFFFLRMFQSFYHRYLQNTTNHVMGSRADHDK